MAQPAAVKLGCTGLTEKLLSSTWKLDRLFVSLKDGSTIGSASGIVQFSRFQDHDHAMNKNNASYLQYYEHGKMTYTAANASSFPFTKRYLISVVPLDKDNKIGIHWYFDLVHEASSNLKYQPNEHNVDTLFVPQNFFIGFEFDHNDYVQHQEISNVQPHLCDKDLYRGSMRFLNDHCFCMRYDVNGPSKMYKIESTYTLQMDAKKRPHLDKAQHDEKEPFQQK